MQSVLYDIEGFNQKKVLTTTTILYFKLGVVGKPIYEQVFSEQDTEQSLAYLLSFKQCEDELL